MGGHGQRHDCFWEKYGFLSQAKVDGATRDDKICNLECCNLMRSGPEEKYEGCAESGRGGQGTSWIQDVEQ